MAAGGTALNGRAQSGPPGFSAASSRRRAIRAAPVRWTCTARAASVRSLAAIAAQISAMRAGPATWRSVAVGGCPRQRAQSADAAIQALHDFPGNIVTGGDEYHLIKPGGRIELTARVVARVSGPDFGQFPKGLRQLLGPKREGCGLVHVASPREILSHRNMILTFSLMV